MLQKHDTTIPTDPAESKAPDTQVSGKTIVPPGKSFKALVAYTRMQERDPCGECPDDASSDNSPPCSPGSPFSDAEPELGVHGVLGDPHLQAAVAAAQVAAEPRPAPAPKPAEPKAKATKATATAKSKSKAKATKATAKAKPKPKAKKTKANGGTTWRRPGRSAGTHRLRLTDDPKEAREFAQAFNPGTNTHVSHVRQAELLEEIAALRAQIAELKKAAQRNPAEAGAPGLSVALDQGFAAVLAAIEQTHRAKEAAIESERQIGSLTAQVAALTEKRETDKATITLLRTELAQHRLNAERLVMPGDAALSPTSGFPSLCDDGTQDGGYEPKRPKTAEGFDFTFTM